MFDAALRPVIDPHLVRLARALRARGFSANQVTFIGAVLAVLMIMALASGWFFLALILVILNRLADGIDGMIARATSTADLENNGQDIQGSDFGGFLDIVADYVFYAGLPLGFALYDPGNNGAAAAFLLFSFILSGITFLAFAAVAARRSLHTAAQGQKTIYYLGGLMEGGETIAFFMLMCLFAPFFDVLATVFGILCCLSAAGRVFKARLLLR